jgi:hypothetical protein
MLAGVKEWCSWCWCLMSEAPLAVVHLLSWELRVEWGWVGLSGRDDTRGIDTDGYTWHWHYGGRLFSLIWIWTDCHGLISYFGTCWNLVELPTIRRSRFNPLNKDLGTYASCQKEVSYPILSSRWMWHLLRDFDSIIRAFSVLSNDCWQKSRSTGYSTFCFSSCDSGGLAARCPLLQRSPQNPTTP